MAKIETLIEQVREVLILTEDSKPRHEIYSQFVNQANSLNLTEDNFYKSVLKVAHKSIDWDYIENQKKLKLQEKKENEEKEKALELELEEVKKQIQYAPQFIDRLIKTAFDDGIVDKDELRLIFDRAERLSQDTYSISDKISALFDEKNFKSYPKANYELPTLRDTLCSTNWYNVEQYNRITEIPKEPYPWKVTIVSTLLLLSVIGALTYLFYLKPKWRDDSAPRFFTAAQDAILRSSQVAGVDYNKLSSLAYGTELITYDHNNEWSQVKANGQEGYVASKLILDKSDFFLLNSIFGDNESKGHIESVKCRLALLKYFKERNYIGKMDESMQFEAFGSVQAGKEKWQVFSKGKTVKPNTIFYPPKRRGAKFTDFAVIIKNVDTNKRKILLFSFNEMEASTLELEQDAPDYGDIRDIDQFISNGKYISRVYF